MLVTVVIDPYSNIMGIFADEQTAKDWLQRGLKGHRVVYTPTEVKPFPDRKLKALSFCSAYLSGQWLCTLETYEVRMQ